MSNIESNISDPAGTPPLSSDVIVPAIDPEDAIVGDNGIREPDGDGVPIEPDPEEGNSHLPPIHRASTTQS